MRIARWSWALAGLLMAWSVPALADDARPLLDREQRQQVESGLRGLTERLVRLRGDDGRAPGVKPDRLADAEVYAKGIAWALRYDSELASTDVAILTRALESGRARVADLESGRAPWAGKKGRVVRGFVSAVDGSVQPFGMIVPAKYDPARPMRLDVVLHGSSRPTGMSELRFMSRFDDPRAAKEDAPDREYIELHPLGRVENGYRWAGETDVFEAIEAACRNYAVDRDRIVLRGMSMGASGTWHLGLKYPDRFVALGPYCGYVDTHEFSRTPLPNFVEVGVLPPHQEKTLHMLDSIDYAANAGVVPAIACMGDKDVFFQAHVIMGRAMAKEGLEMVNLISPGTGHVLDPATHAEQLKRIGAIAAKGIDRSPRHIRFVTWTLKYSRCHWLQILGMEEHYARAELDARLDDDGTVEVAEPKNVTRFAILPPATQAKELRIRVGGSSIAIPARTDDGPGRKIVIARRDGRWQSIGELDDLHLDGKRPGLQGPIDDAFTSPFLCVRGTGSAWNPAVNSWAEANLKRFAYEWSRYFRGELPVKDDTAVTPDDVRRCNLILFGDPGSNLWIRRVLPRLPIRWTREECAIGAMRVGAADHAAVLIQPSPLAAGRYVVLNSGHTFHEQELSTLNYLLFPRLGDWAVIKVGDKVPADPAGSLGDAVVRTGFFDERWSIPEAPDDRQALDDRLAPFFHPPAELANDMGAYRSPLLFRDGSPVRTAADWDRRRREIRADLAGIHGHLAAPHREAPDRVPRAGTSRSDHPAPDPPRDRPRPHDGGRLSPAAGRRRTVPGGARGLLRREDRDRPGQGGVAGFRLPTGATRLRRPSRWAWTRRRPIRPSRSPSSRPSPSTRTRPRTATTPWRACLGSIPAGSASSVIRMAASGPCSHPASSRSSRAGSGPTPASSSTSPGRTSITGSPGIWAGSRAEPASRACRPPRTRGPAPTNA